MIDLGELDKQIDELLAQETPDSLSKWLLNKRLGNINNLIGSGTFIGMQRKNEVVFTCKQKASFNQEAMPYPSNPINRKAA